MDSRLQDTLDYAKEEIAEIEQFRSEGKLTDKGVFIRIFELGKTLLGWDDDAPVNESINRFLQANNTVQEYLKSARKARAS